MHPCAQVSMGFATVAWKSSKSLGELVALSFSVDSAHRRDPVVWGLVSVPELIAPRGKRNPLSIGR